MMFKARRHIAKIKLAQATLSKALQMLQVLTNTGKEPS